MGKDATRARSVALVALSVGTILVLAAPALSLFSLIAVFLMASCPGIVIGYLQRNRWSESMIYALTCGTVAIASLVVFVVLFGR